MSYLVKCSVDVNLKHAKASKKKKIPAVINLCLRELNALQRPLGGMGCCSSRCRYSQKPGGTMEMSAKSHSAMGREGLISSIYLSPCFI